MMPTFHSPQGYLPRATAYPYSPPFQQPKFAAPQNYQNDEILRQINKSTPNSNVNVILKQNYQQKMPDATQHSFRNYEKVASNAINSSQATKPLQNKVNQKERQEKFEVIQVNSNQNYATKNYKDNNDPAEQLRKQNQDLAMAIKQADQKNKQLEEEIESLRNNLTGVCDEVNMLEKEKNELSSLIEQSNSQINQFQTILEEKDKEVQLLAKQITTQRQTQTKVTTELQRVRGRSNDRGSPMKNETVKIMSRELSHQFKNIEKESKQQNDQFNQNTQNLNQLMKENEKLKQLVKEKEDEMRKKDDIISQNLSNSKSRVSEFEMDGLAHYKKIISSFERSAKEIKQKNADYQTEIQKLTEQINTMKKGFNYQKKKELI